MKIGFIVGEMEQHQMELSYDQPTGDLRLTMDGLQVLRDSPTLSFEPVKLYELSVGDQEKHLLTFQLTDGDQEEEPGAGVTPRVSLKVTALHEVPAEQPIDATHWRSSVLQDSI